MADIQFIDGADDKDEDAYVLAYLSMCFENEQGTIVAKRIPEENVTRPDYFVTNNGELLEVKEVHDRSHNEQWAAWGRKITAIKTAVAGLGDDGKVYGTYIVNAPEVFSLSRSPRVQTAGARQIIEAVNTGQKFVDVFDTRFTISKVSNDGHYISFGNISEGRSINPAGTVADGMKSGIAKANEQLNSPPDGLVVEIRKLLFINRYIFRLRDWELFNATSYVYKELDEAERIDEAWVQYRNDDDTFHHKRIYNRKFFAEFNADDVSNWGEAEFELFADWFPHIFEWSDEHKEKLLNCLKQLLANNKPYDIFKSPINRTEMIKLGSWLAENKRYEEALWLAEQFVDDPNDFTDDEGKNFPDKLADGIRSGEEVVQISTVLGQLAWLVNQMTVSKEHIVKVADLTLKLLANENLYVKSMAMLPLKNLLQRQQLLKEHDTENETDYFSTLREVAFDLMREYGQYLTTANLLSTTFYYLLDLTEEETIEVLEKLKVGKNSGYLYIYFSFFRAEQTDDFGPYDNTAANEQLMSVLNGNSEVDDNLTADITFRIWKYLKEHPEDFDKFLPTLKLIAARPYSRANYSIEHIIGDWAERKPEECIVLFTSLINGMVAVVDEEQIVGRMWISSEAMLPVIARQQPELLIEVVDNLMVLWDKGTMVGHPSAVLTSYQHIEDQELREQAKARFVEHYGHMKSVNPRIEEITFL